MCALTFSEPNKIGPMEIGTKVTLPVNYNMPRRFGARYKLTFGERTSGPVNAIYYDWKHGTFWGGSSNNGEDYGIGW